jgi:type II secretory pathway pseudopilin PulG
MALVALLIIGLLLLLAISRLVRPVASSEAKADATSTLPFWVGLVRH